MLRLSFTIVLTLFVADSLCQRFIHPTYRPPPQRPIIIRTARDTGDQEPLWLYQGDIPRAPASSDPQILPNIIDDVRFNPDRRYARSVDSPSARRSGGTRSTSSGSRNTGPTHPGYNRRNARDLASFMPRPPTFPDPRPLDPFNPFPRPGSPRRPYPIYVNRPIRDVHGYGFDAELE